MCNPQTCSTCLHGEPDDLADRTCENELSEHYGEWVGDDDTCEAWEGNCENCIMAGEVLYPCDDCDGLDKDDSED